MKPKVTEPWFMCCETRFQVGFFKVAGLAAEMSFEEMRTVLMQWMLWFWSIRTMRTKMNAICTLVEWFTDNRDSNIFCALTIELSRRVWVKCLLPGLNISKNISYFTPFIDPLIFSWLGLDNDFENIFTPVFTPWRVCLRLWILILGHRFARLSVFLCWLGSQICHS